MDKLADYIQKLSKLNRAYLNGERAPHKPVLLLAIIRLLDHRLINENRIYITSELVTAFKDLWHLLVTSTQFKDNFYLPFYHLQSEGFWHLHTYPGKEIVQTRSKSIGSFSQLKDSVWYAYFDEALFDLLVKDADRAIIQQVLLQAYFPTAHASILQTSSAFIKQIEGQILKEPAAVYRQQVAKVDEEEILVRSALFRKLVTYYYDNTCCVSRMKVMSDDNTQIIDACHIIPFAQFGIDNITNGISLCPNLHRAFDRGLFTIDEQYRVRLSSGFTESATVYGLRQFENVAIILPTEKSFYPSMKSLAWHQRQWKFKT